MSSPGASHRTAGPRLPKGRRRPRRSRQKNHPSPRAPGATQKTRGSEAGSPKPSEKLAWSEPGGLDASRPTGSTTAAPLPRRPRRAQISSASSSIGLVLPST
jgi:hypothetical protein